MKRTVFFAAILGLLSIASCGKECVSCKQNGSNEVKICRNSYDSDTEYTIAINFQEQVQNYECND